MELCYIWVEEFRNIIKTGFNFSAEYIFDYDVHSNRLILTKNPRFIPDFFHPGITNITGIIGQNGAGKTNLLELVDYVMNEGNTKIRGGFFIIYRNPERDGELIGLSHKMDHTPVSESGILFSQYKAKENPFKNIFISNVFDGRKHELSKETLDASTNKMMANEFGENFQRNFQSDLQKQIDFLDSPNFKHLANLEKSLAQDRHFNLYPSNVLLTSPAWGNIILRAGAFDKRLAEMGLKQSDQLKPLCQAFRKKISKNPESTSDRRTLSYLTAFLLFIDFVLNELSIKPSKKKREIGKNSQGELLTEFIRMAELQALAGARINEMHEFFTGKLAKFIDERFPYLYEKSRFLTELQNPELYETEKNLEGTYSNRKIQLRMEYNQEVGSFLKKYLEAGSNENLTYSIDWEGISSGHKAFLGLFSRFNQVAMSPNLKEQNILITIDEGDLYFHPKWQTEFLYKLIHLLPKFFEGKRIQMILTTHSPFLVSDLPKDNLLFFGKSETGNCRVIPSEEIKGMTFGGNIGELYLDAFFMDGQLISRFAEMKIKHLIKRAKGKEKLTNEDKILLDSIGEELIKFQIQSIIND